ncbi:MAG: hypothetical protein CSA72_09535 [Rhodobacterales bacterium]|nr:MAG: hypothetical protein CSA72_09535 [Rhodobacterales bacterium]
MQNEKIDGRIHGPQLETEPDNLLMRVLYSILIAMMIGLTQSVLTVITLIQIVIMALNKGTPNENLADFGTDLGVWLAKAVRYLTAASHVKPWPWTELD